MKNLIFVVLLLFVVPTITISDVNHFHIYGPNTTIENLSGYASGSSEYVICFKADHNALVKGDASLVRANVEEARVYIDAEL